MKANSRLQGLLLGGWDIWCLIRLLKRRRLDPVSRYNLLIEAVLVVGTFVCFVLLLFAANSPYWGTGTQTRGNVMAAVLVLLL
jgi:hypothetical protein